MRDEKNHEYDSLDDEATAPATDEELMYLNAGYVHYDDFQSDTDWGDNLELETGIKFS